MVTYISLLVGMISAILGVLLKSRKKVGDKEVFSKWVWLFLAVPLLAFGVSAAKTYMDGVDAAAAKTEAERDATAAENRRIEEAKLAESRRSQELALSEKRRTDELAISDQKLALAETRRVQEALAAQILLDIVRNKVDQSIQQVAVSRDRVDVVEAQITYSFPLSQLPGGRGIKPLLKDLMRAETVGLGGPHDTLIFAVVSDQFDFFPLPENYARVSSEMNAALQEMGLTADPLFILSGPALSQGQLAQVAAAQVINPLSSILLFNKIEGRNDISSYRLINPRKIVGVPPVSIAYAHESWRILDIKAADPTVELTWRFRFLSVPNRDLVTFKDYKKASVVFYAPRLNPNLNRGANTMAFAAPFGAVQRAEIAAGGVRYAWKAGDPEITPAAARQSGKPPLAMVAMPKQEIIPSAR